MGNIKSVALKEFTEKVVDGIKDYLPEGFAKAETTVRTVAKNNNRRYVALTVRHKEQNIAPVVYLDPYFKRYEDGSGMETILADIAGVIENHEPENPLILIRLWILTRSGIGSFRGW